jgi:hypothetical protein
VREQALKVEKSTTLRLMTQVAEFETLTYSSTLAFSEDQDPCSSWYPYRQALGTVEEYSLLILLRLDAVDAVVVDFVDVVVAVVAVDFVDDGAVAVDEM